MPTIVFVSPKGGAGKTTSALVLATQLAKNAPVTVIDADPNHPIATWATGDNTPVTMTVIKNDNAETISDDIEAAAKKTPFVIVDLEGTAATIVFMAISMADFVIVPTQGSELDAQQAGRALNLIRQHEKAVQKNNRSNIEYKLPFAVLLTRTNPAIKTRTLKHIYTTLTEANIPVFETQLNEREAFRSMFSFRQPLETLSNAEVSNIDKAIINSENFMNEVLQRITGATK